MPRDHCLAVHRIIHTGSWSLVHCFPHEVCVCVCVCVCKCMCARTLFHLMTVALPTELHQGLLVANCIPIMHRHRWLHRSLPALGTGGSLLNPNACDGPVIGAQ